MSLQEATLRVQQMEQHQQLLTDCWSVESPPSYNNSSAVTSLSIPHTIARLQRHHGGASDKENTSPEEQERDNTCTASSDAESCSNDNNNNPDLSNIPEWPSYLRMLASGEFDRRLEEATNMFTACVACGRFCEVDRLSSDKADWGECRIGQQAIVSAVDAHFGEEPCLRGVNGSGTIFFGACNLKCIYCQNWKLSAMDQGEVVSDERLADYMLHLQERGCHNINFVSPTHNILPLLRGVYIAAKRGLRLPIVFNSGGYDSVASLRLLEGIIDIYMPDAKYSSRAVARKLSKIDNYVEINQAAIKEMHRQVGDLQIDPRTGLAYRGLLVRHLVLPNDYGGTHDVADFLFNEISQNTYTHVMKYYRPEHEATDDTKYGLNRRPSNNELAEALKRARFAGLNRILY
ncbi:radical SAM domain protein [Seminavis robusta]|uniref:Radical SAM domain protein n=1 Tax=Seminavis robusta TaxID=568900 RepID=A0A9N8E785_9STRA|nr:radical SAM domain protein [Seminavis robusta]|eukprot:Sro755_g197660.1 radical SAM domain protein (404) ;mRNA; r:41653-42864